MRREQACRLQDCNYFRLWQATGDQSPCRRTVSWLQAAGTNRNLLRRRPPARTQLHPIAYWGFECQDHFF